MADDFAPLNLRARLTILQDRIAQAHHALETHGIVGPPLEALNDIGERQESIRESLESQATVTELHHGKASAQTDALEAALNSWLTDLESKFNAPTSRNPSASF
jgi:hypothetical protein